MVPAKYQAQRTMNTSSRPGPPPGTAPGASTHRTKTPSAAHTRNIAQRANPRGSTTERLRRRSWSAITTDMAIGMIVMKPSAHHNGTPRKRADNGQWARHEPVDRDGEADAGS